MRIWSRAGALFPAGASLAFFIPFVVGVGVGRFADGEVPGLDHPRAAPAAPAAAPALTIESIVAHDPTATVRDLRAGERLVLWQPQDHDQIIWGGGARASLFTATSAGWRHVGDVDSESDSSHVRPAFVDKAQGIAYLIEEFQGNGYPPSRAYAVAIVDDRVDSITSGLVADVDDDSDRELRLWRRPESTNRYPDRPTRAARWNVHRATGGLWSNETALTPWVDVLEAFCSGVHPELASEQARARVARCEGAATLRWQGVQVVAELELALYCDDSVDETSAYGALVLKDTAQGWRVVDVRGCGA